MFCENPRILIRNADGKLKKPLTKLDSVLYELKFLNTPYTPYNEAHKPTGYENTVRVPCGRCLFCRMEQRREWALRCWLEAQEHDNNQFITLTYDDKHLPDLGVSKAELSRFMHTLREYFRRERKHSGIRFFACGEYGEKNFRAHYHVLLFNCPPFGDEKFYKKNKQKQSLYKSRLLDKLWGKGGCVIGAVTRQSCDYVAKHQLKSYGVKLPERLCRQFQSMSNQSGLGLNYLLRNFDDILATDKIQVTGSIAEKSPHYFDRKIEEIIGAERFEEEIAKPRREKATAFIAEAVKRTGLSENEVYRQLMANEKAKIKNEIKKIKENNHDGF